MTGQAGEARQARKAAAIQDIEKAIFAETGLLVSSTVHRYLAQLYDTAAEAGRLHAMEPGYIMVDAREPWRPGEPYGHAILSELAKLAPGHTGLTLGELTTLVRTTGWDVSRTNVRHELFNLISAGLVRFDLPADKQTRYLPVRDGAR